MSTSDAGQLELRVVGGETDPPLYGTAPATRTTTTASKHQDETLGKRFTQENHHGDETPTEQHCQQSAVEQRETHKALILRADETSHCGDSEVQTQKPVGPRFSSSLFLRLSRHIGLNKPELILKENLDPCLQSLIEPQQVETKDNSFQVNGRTSSPDTFIETIPFPAKKEEEIVTAVCNEHDITRDLSVTHYVSNADSGQHDGLHVFPHASQPRTCTRLLTGLEFEEDITDQTRLETQTDLGELPDRSATMLSSTVVSVLAPHWRLRRTKRFDGTGSSDALGNLQDVPNTTTNRQPSFQGALNQHGVGRVLTDGSQAQMRVPFLGSRRNTVDWSTKSESSSLDESKRKMTQTVSLDVNSGRMDNRKIDAGALSPSATTAPPRSPLFLDPNEQRRNPQTEHQGRPSPFSSKPTASSLLLSLRRSNGRNSELNSSPMNTSPTDRNGKMFTTHLSQSFLNNNEQDRPKPLLSPTSMSYRTRETGPVRSPSSSNQRERKISDSLFFPTSPIKRDTEDMPFSQQHQAVGRSQPSPTSSKQVFLGKEPSERPQSNRGSGKSTNLLPESSVSSSRQSPYDRSALQKTHSIPRRTLTSTSWWKQVTQEGGSPFTLKDTPNIKEKPNTPVVPPSNNNNTDAGSPSLTDNKRLGSQIDNNRDNNNTAESVYKGNMNLVLKTRGGTQSLTQRTAENSPDHESDRLVKQQFSSNLNNREPQKPHSVPDVLSSSKFSRAASQTALSHSKEPSKHDASNSSFTANVTELPPTLLNPKSSNPPTESSSKYQNNQCPTKTNNTPVSPHNVDSLKFSKPSFSLDFPTNSQTTSGFPPTPNTKSTVSFQSQPASPQTSIRASSYTGSLSQTPKLTNKVNSTPLGFERSYASIPKPFHPKAVSNLIPTVSSFSKTNYNPVSSASTTSSSATTSPSLLSPPVTPGITSSPTPVSISSLLTPPATPVITSPNSETSSPKGGRTFSSSLERGTKKQCPEAKRVRRVTWEDSVDLKCSEPVAAEKTDAPQVPKNPLSPSRSPRNTPSIFSFLRSSSPGTSPLFSPTPKTSSIQVGKEGGKYRSLSSDSAELAFREREKNKQRSGDMMTFDQGRQDLATPRQERTLSVESGTAQCRSPAPLSLPPDFSGAYKLRYSSPPYSTLMSSRLAQGDNKSVIPRLSLFPQSPQSNYTPVMSRPPHPPFRPSQSLSLSFPNKIATQETPKSGVLETYQANNNLGKNSSQDIQNSQIQLVDNRVHVRSQSLQGDKPHSSSSTFVTETLVYSVKAKIDTATAAPMNTTPKPLQQTANTPVSVETKLSQQSHTGQSKEAASEPCSHSDQSSSGSSSTESQSREDRSHRMKETVLGKSRFFSVEVNNEQSPKKSRFALTKSVSTPNSILSRSDSEKVSKGKMDQVFNKLKQKFSTRRSDDDSSFPWKWKRGSQTPSVSGSSDVSDTTVESTKTVEERVQEKGQVLNDNKKNTDGKDRWSQNRYTIIPPLGAGSTAAGQFSPCSTLETDQDQLDACAEHTSENQIHLTIHSPTSHQFDFYPDSGTDYEATNQFLSCRDASPGRSANPSAAYPTPGRKATSSPRSPFSPFSSLSPVSPFSSTDVTDDSVFYSPKLQRRRDSPSPCEPADGISLGGSRRSRASTGPPSAGPGLDKERMASSYADLKYGIEPGRSFSVSSVLSSRPSGPGRISTGSRFMSVGDLSQRALSCGANSTDLEPWSVNPDWTTDYDCQHTNERPASYFPSDPGKMRSRSLPRSLTRCLANWSSAVSPSEPVTSTASKPAHLRSPNMNTCHFVWDTEGPPTPPPTPPRSPVSRRMSKPPSLSSPTFPSPPGPAQQLDSQSSRGHLPSRSYKTSLSTFEESSDSSSDTTTDDEYYLETDEDGEKETEL